MTPTESPPSSTRTARRGVPPALEPKLVGAWSKTLRLGATRSLRAPVVRDRFTLMARVRVTGAGTIAQRGSAFRLTTRGGQVGKSTARLSVPRARWTHVAMTYDAPPSARTATASWSRASAPAPPGGFEGRVRDIRLYDGTLAAAEITRAARR